MKCVNLCNTKHVCSSSVFKTCFGKRENNLNLERQIKYYCFITSRNKIVKNEIDVFSKQISCK